AAEDRQAPEVRDVAVLDRGRRSDSGRRVRHLPDELERDVPDRPRLARADVTATLSERWSRDERERHDKWRGERKRPLHAGPPWLWAAFAAFAEDIAIGCSTAALAFVNRAVLRSARRGRRPGVLTSRPARGARRRPAAAARRSETAGGSRVAPAERERGRPGGPTRRRALGRTAARDGEPQRPGVHLPAAQGAGARGQCGRRSDREPGARLSLARPTGAVRSPPLRETGRGGARCPRGRRCRIGGRSASEGARTLAGPCARRSALRAVCADGGGAARGDPARRCRAADRGRPAPRETRRPRRRARAAHHRAPAPGATPRTADAGPVP